jgi:hypothetical protein
VNTSAKKAKNEMNPNAQELHGRNAKPEVDTAEQHAQRKCATDDTTSKVREKKESPKWKLLE